MRWLGWRAPAALVLVATAMYLFGFPLLPAAVGGLVVGVVTLLVQRLDAEDEPDWTPPGYDRRRGARGDVQELAWSVAGRDGRAGERVLRRLRDVARVRLARHGLDLDDPADSAAVERLVGGRAHATLTRRSHPLPRVSDLQHTLEVLERLGPARHDAAPASSTPAPDGRVLTPRTRRNPR